MKMTSKINPILDKIIEEAKDKNIKFNERAPNNLFLTNPFISFLKCFLKKSNNDFNSFNLETLPKEFLDQCFEEDEHLKFRTLYFKNNNLQLFTMKDVLNKLTNLFDNDFLKYLKDNFGNITIKEMYSMIYNNIIDSEKEKERIEKFTKIVTIETNQKVKLELDAKDLYLLSLFIEKQNHIHCKAIFIINFLLESFIRGNNDAYYKLLEFADLRNEKLNEFTESLESNEVDNLDEEEWLLKLLAQHTLGVIYGCKIRLSKPNKNRSTALFNNVYENYLKIKEHNRDTICKIPQSIICCLAVQQFSISEYNDNFDLLWEGGFKDNNSWCLLKLLKLGVDLPHHDIETIKETLESQENVLYLNDVIKNLDNIDIKIEHDLQSYCKRGYAPLFQKLETIYNQKKQQELLELCNKMFLKFKPFMNNKDEIIQYNIFTTQTQFDHLMIDFPLNPIIVNAISKDSEDQVRDSLELLMDQYNEIKLYLIIGPFLNKLNNEWNDLKLKLNELNMNDDDIVKSIINEFNNYTLLKQLLNNEKQDIDSILNYFLQHSNDLNENTKQLLENYFNETQKEQQVSISTFINEPLSSIETNVTSSQLIMIDPRYCCKEHGYPLKYICYRCNDVIVCPECGINSHNGHNLKLINDIITMEINKVKELKQKLENKTQTLQQSLQQVEQSITKVNNQKEHEITKLDQSANNLINAIQKRRDILKDNLNQKHNERITILENEKTNLTENIQFIQNEVTNININELQNNGIELINKRKELNNFELKKLNNSSSSLLSNTFLNTCNQFEIVLSFEEQEWINKINKQFGYVVDGIVNPSLCFIEDIPNIFIKDENYKLKLQLKCEKGNLLKGGYLIKSFILNESGDKKIDDCKVIDNENGTYFIEFKCPSVNSIKLKTLIEDKEMKVLEFKVFNYELICSSDLVENKLIKLNLKSNLNLGQLYLVYNGCNGKDNCNVINNNDNTFTIEFKCPSNPFKLFTLIEKEILLYEFKNVVNLINCSEILNYNSTRVLIEKELIKLTLQLKTNNNINYTKNDINIQSYLTLKENNTKIEDCKVINNNNGTFTIEFKSPSINQNEILLNCLIEDKPIKNSPFKFEIVKPEINILNDTKLIYNQLNTFTLQFQNNQNQLRKVENVDIQSFIHLNQSNSNNILMNCNVINNNNGTFNIQFNTPIENKYKSIYLSIKINDNLLNNIPFTFTPNYYGISFSNQFNYYKTIGSGSGSNNGQFNYPFDIKFDEKDNLIFVADYNNYRIQVFDVEGNYKYQLKTPSYPWFIAIDYFKEGNEILVGCSDYKIYRFEKKENGKQLQQVIGSGGSGNGDDQFNFNYGGMIIDSNNGNIYISDSCNHRIKVYSNAGQLLKKFTNGFQHSYKIDFNSKGNLIIADYSNCKIQILNKEDGNVISTIQHQNYTNRPLALVVDKTNDNIYISNHSNHCISVFDKNGQFIKQFGKYGSGNGEFNYIWALALNSNNGQLYVVDRNNHRIQMFK